MRIQSTLSALRENWWLLFNQSTQCELCLETPDQNAFICSITFIFAVLHPVADRVAVKEGAAAVIKCRGLFLTAAATAFTEYGFTALRTAETAPGQVGLTAAADERILIRGVQTQLTLGGLIKK